MEFEFSALIRYKHKSPFLNSTHAHTLVDITIQTILESDTAIFLKPDFNITSIYCFVPLLHCRLDLKAISANARAWSMYDSCWFVIKLSSESSAFGGPSPSFPEPPHTQEPLYPSPCKDGTRRTLGHSGYRRLPLSQLLLDLRPLWQTEGCFFYNNSMQTRSTHQWRFACGNVSRLRWGHKVMGRIILSYWSHVWQCMSQWDHTMMRLIDWVHEHPLVGNSTGDCPRPGLHILPTLLATSAIPPFLGKNCHQLPSIAQYNMSKAQKPSLTAA